MKRLKMFIFGVVALALLCFFSAPMVQAQVLDVTTHELKLSASAVSVLVPPGATEFVIERTGGKVAGPVVLRFTGNNFSTGGFNYNINLLEEPDSGYCVETTIGTFSTYNIVENMALGVLTIVGKDVPEPGLDLFGSFFAKVKINPQKPGKSSFKSVSGWAEVEVHEAGDPDPDGMTKNFKVKGKEKTLQQLGLQCNLGVAP